jgi:NAD(P) transhydrogenase
VARAGKSEEDCTAEGIPCESGRCGLGITPRGLIAGQEGLLKLVFHGRTGVLLGVHAICEIASEISGTGQAMIRNGAAIEDVIRTAYNTPTYTYGYKLAGSDVLAWLHPDVLRAIRLPSRAYQI